MKEIRSKAHVVSKKVGIGSLVLLLAFGVDTQVFGRGIQLFDNVTIECPISEPGTIIEFSVNDGEAAGKILFDVLASDTIRERIFLDNVSIYTNIIQLDTTNFQVRIPPDMDELTPIQQQVLGAIPQLLSSPTIIEPLFNCVKRDVDKFITQPSSEVIPLTGGGGDGLCEFGCVVSETLIDLALFFGASACCAGTVGTACIVCGSAAVVGAKASSSLSDKCKARCP